MPPHPSSHTSLIIPAHNEERGIRRLLDGLLANAAPSEFEILIVCNGCTDRTAEVARSYGDVVRVIVLDEPSKSAALRAGDAAALFFPRLYIDADVELSAAAVREIGAALEQPGVLAAGPTRVMPMDNVSSLVRRYYQVWERLPQVRVGLFGRGVIGFSEAGHKRVRDLPQVMSDDLAISEAFTAAERAVTLTATVVVHPPKTIRDLVRRRVRVHTGNAQLDQSGSRSAEAKTSIKALLQIAWAEPRMAANVIVFAGVAAICKIAARRRVQSGDYTTWARDQSSRDDSAVK